MKLSLIVTYRQRETHLKAHIDWWKQQAYQDVEVIIVEADEQASKWLEPAIAPTKIKYTFLPCNGVFHKTKALNLGLSIAQGEFVAPFDVDLLPLGNTLLQHLQIAQLAPQLLVTGYRIMSKTEEPIDISACSIAPEDMPTALWKQLVNRERFGVVPYFNRDRLQKIGGWDEKFIGWGGEDQDIIERYLQTGYHLCRCPELVYLHLPHPPNQLWTETSLIEQNRKYYYSKKATAT